MADPVSYFFDSDFWQAKTSKNSKPYQHAPVIFKIMTTDESTEIGKISKQWSGLLKEAFTDTDNFGIRSVADEAVDFILHNNYSLVPNT